MASSTNKYKIIASVEVSDAELKKQLAKYKGIDLSSKITGVKESTKSISSLTSEFDKLKSSVGKVAQFGIATAMLGAVTAGASTATSSIFETNKALTELSKVSDLSGKSLREYSKVAYELGNDVSRFGIDAIEAITEFKKSGQDLAKSEDLAKTSLIFQNIADSAVSAGDSASFLTSQMKAFNITAEDSVKIIDVVNAVSNGFSVSSTDLSTALSKTSSAMAVLGNTYEETVALVTAGTEIMTGQAGKVGRGLRTIGNNLADLANKSGELEYKMNGSVETLSLIDSKTGDLKSTFEIFSDIYANGWNDMSKAEQQALAISLSGKQQFEVFTATMMNFEQAQSANTTALMSAGSAMREQEAYAKSLEARVNSIKNSFSQWANQGAGFVSITLGMADAFLKVNNNIEILIPSLFLLASSTIPMVKLAIKSLAETAFVSLGIGTGGLTWIIAGIIMAVGSLPKLFDAVTVSIDELKTNLADATTELEDITSKISDLKNKENLSEKDELYLKVLQAQTVELEKQIAKDKERLAQKELLGRGITAPLGASYNANLATGEIQKLQSHIAKLEVDIANTDESRTSRLENLGERLAHANDKLLENYNKLQQEQLKLMEGVENLTGADKEQVETLIQKNDAVLKSIEATIELEETTARAKIEIEDLGDEVDQTAITIKSSADIIKELNSELDEMQSVYNTVTDAINQCNESGSMNLDTFQSLMDVGSEYLSLLFDEEGNLLNVSDALIRVAEAKIDEMAITKARELIDMASKLNDETFAVSNLAIGYSEANVSLWEFVGGSVALQKALGADTGAIEAQINSIQRWSEQAKSSLKTVGMGSSSRGSRGGSKKDVWKEEFNRQYKDLKHQLAMNEITEKQYLDKLEVLYKKYFANRKEYTDEFNKYEEETYKIRLKIAEEAIKRENKREENRIQRKIDKADREIKKLQELKQQETEYYDNRIEAINKANDALKEANELEKAQEALAKAKQTTRRIYRDGKFVYEQDLEAVEEAQFALDEIKREQAVRAEIERLEKMKEATIANIDKQIVKWEEYRDKWEENLAKYKENQNEFLDVMAQTMAKESEGFDERLSNVRDFVDEYNSIMSELGDEDGGGKKKPSKGSGGGKGSISGVEVGIKEHAKDKVKGKYANGTTSALGGLSLVGERGAELRVLGQGDGIIPNNMTKNLMQLGRYSLPQLKSMLTDGSQGGVVNNFDKIVLPNVTDWNSFENELSNIKNLAIQRTGVRG